jgi:hypothetical protein
VTGHLERASNYGDKQLAAMPQPSPPPTGNYQSDNLTWRWQQSQRQFGEWWEQLFAQPSARPRAQPAPPWWGWEILQMLVLWALLAVLIAIVVWLLWRWGQSAWRSDRAPRVWAQPLPTRPERPVNEWLNLVQQAQKRGDYAQACRWLYCAMLQLLHDRQVIPHRLSQTNGEYRQLVQPFPGQPHYETLIQTHEQVHFGGDASSIEQYQQCQRAYQNISQQ